MWDPLAVINAVEGDSAFYMSERGWVELTPKGETIFTPDPNGNYRTCRGRTHGQTRCCGGSDDNA